MSEDEKKESAVGKLRVPQQAKKDFSYLKNYFTQVAEEEAHDFSLDPNEKVRFKTMIIEYLNLVLKTQRDLTEYVGEDEEEEQMEAEAEAEDELFEQKSQLLKRVLVRKMEQCRATVPTPMTIDIKTTKPDNLYILKNGQEVPIESELNFTPLEEFPQKIQALHEQQHHFCNLYREMMAHQKWLGDKKI